MDYLSGIKSDLEQDIKHTKRQIRGKIRKISAFQKLDSTYIPRRRIILQDISLDSIDIEFMFDRGPVNRLKLGSYTALTSNASTGLIKNKELIQSIQHLYEIRLPSILSVHEDIKRREEHLGWKYAHELRNLDLKSFFITNPEKEEVLDDFAFYIKQHELMCRFLMQNLEIMDEIIKAIEAEIEQR